MKLLIFLFSILFLQTGLAQTLPVPDGMIAVVCTKPPFDGDGGRFYNVGDPQKKVYKIRFANYDAPEFKAWTTTVVQVYAVQSRDSLRTLVHRGDTLWIAHPYVKKNKWSFDRKVMDVYLPATATREMTLISAIGIERGWGHYEARPKDKRTEPAINENLAVLYERSKRKKHGLFDPKWYIGTGQTIILPATHRRKFHR